jgi:dihydroneopterin aldolase
MADSIDADLAPAPLALQPVVVRQTVVVEDIRVEAFIGVHGHEKDRRQSLIVGVELEIVSPGSDSVAETIDYNRIVDCCRKLSDRGIGLIETFARQLGEELFTDRRVLRAQVSVTKPGALPNGVARATASLVRSAA